MTAATPLRKTDAPKGEAPNNLAQALKAAKKAVEPITKEKKGQRGKYAPLDLVLETVEAVLDAHDCLLTQPTVIDKEIGQLVVRSTIEHVITGEFKVAEWPAGEIKRRTLTMVTDDGTVYSKEQEPTLHQQELGGGTTYGRRYSLLALLGLAPEDEDNDAGNGRSAPQRGHTPPPRQTAPTHDKETADQIAKFTAAINTALMNCESEADVEALWKASAGKLQRLRRIDAKAADRIEGLKAKRIADFTGEVIDDFPGDRAP